MTQFKRHVSTDSPHTFSFHAERMIENITKQNTLVWFLISEAGCVTSLQDVVLVKNFSAVMR